MNVRLCISCLVTALLVLEGGSYACAADDHDPDTFNWNLIPIPNITVPYVEAATDLPLEKPTKALFVTANFLDEHCESDEGHHMNHWHYQKDFSDADFPTVAEANRFWDWRFGIVSYDPDKTTRVSDATTLHNCHSYGFSQRSDGGHYNYYCTQFSTGYTDDFVKRSSI